MVDVHVAARDVVVDNVESKVKGFGMKTEGKVKSIRQGRICHRNSGC